MADPLQVVQSLDRLAERYTVFEPDQVLTHGQLNGVTDYLDDQTRLSRVCLHGVGLVAGLQVQRTGAGVRVGRGLGVTTDGDLLRLGTDTVYDRWRAYDSSYPVYPPLWTGGAEPQPLDAAELVPVGESDVLARPLAELPGGIDGRVVLLLMESIVQDPDMCSGTDCDNLGRDARHRLRVMAVPAPLAQQLMDAVGLMPASERARSLPALAMRRPALSTDIGTTGTLATRYRDAAGATLAELRRALQALARAFPDLLQEVFGGDPTARWLARLDALVATFAGTSSGLQVWWSFVKDTVDQWATLRDALLADDSVLLPAVDAFPKHLLLGTVGAPRELRMGLYPSPLDAASRHGRAHARFALWKLDAMLAAFAMPADTTLRVTPSRGDAQPLAGRAIPWHYRVLEASPIHVAWDFQRAARGQEGEHLGYRAASWASTEQARSPLQFAIGGHDFFRVEGHLGRPVEQVGNELRALIARHNLPFQVQEVLLHNDRRQLRRRPPLRYTPLHSLHYLLRQDVALRIDESRSVAARFATDVAGGVAAGIVPAATDSGAQTVTLARSAQDAVARVQEVSAPVLASRSYTSYQAQTTQNPTWKSAYATGLETVSQSKASLGHLSRADHASPFDALISSNQPHWIDWLDVLIQAQDDRADDRLLFTRYLQDHPALDHAGGAWRGGTFVLVYDDSGRVVADFTLPYPAAEEDQPEPEEPPLTRPPYRPPVAVDGGIRITRPVPMLVDDSVLRQRELFRFDLEKTTANIEGLVQGAFVPNNAVDNPKVVAPGRATGNAWLDYNAGVLDAQMKRVRELEQLVSTPSVGDPVREAAQRELVRTQGEMAQTVGVLAGEVAASGLDVSSTAGAAVTQRIASGAAQVKDGNARGVMLQQLDAVQTPAGSATARFVDGLKALGRVG
ncbi:hypothetical protein [Rubrivivax albus]|uniref:Uncharacterized protein n=1 Tax=Rubrivivax albus TaxID=2499835 RepID=A0A437JQ64_9BURK|nr:hypothetical protein [Rubrivivax albus]RVT48936.1 hypothetical protein ENE75_21545 [Rubrivivax albus]